MLLIDPTMKELRKFVWRSIHIASQSNSSDRIWPINQVHTAVDSFGYPLTRRQINVLLGLRRQIRKLPEEDRAGEQQITEILRASNRARRRTRRAQKLA